MYDLGVKMSADLIPRLVGKNRVERIAEIVQIMNETGFVRGRFCKRRRQTAARGVQELRVPRLVEGLPRGLPFRHRIPIRPDGGRNRTSRVHAARRRLLSLPVHTPQPETSDAKDLGRHARPAVRIREQSPIVGRSNSRNPWKAWARSRRKKAFRRPTPRSQAREGETGSPAKPKTRRQGGAEDPFCLRPRPIAGEGD